MQYIIRVAVCCLAIQGLSAQMTNLATSADGSVVYFSTKLRPVGTTAGYTPKILSLAAGGNPVVFAERAMEETGLTNPFLLDAPSVSDDGAVAAYSGAKACMFLHCSFHWSIGSTEKFQGDVVLGTGQSLATGDGVVSVSPNGRYAVFHSRGEESRKMPYDYLGLLTVMDLTTGQKTEAVPGFNLNRANQPVLRTRVASNGIVAGMGGNRKSLFLFDGSSLRTIGLTREAYRFGMDDQARVPYFESGTGTGSEIALYDVASNWEQAAVSCPEGAWQPSVSSDGNWLLFLSPANFAGQNPSKHIQAFLMRTDGSELRQLTRPDDEIDSAVLAGNGTVAYASTTRNQLLRIDVIDGRVEEIIAATPELIEDWILAAPGSALELDGRELTGARVLLNGAPLQVLWSSPQRIAVQIPLDTPQGPVTLTLDSPQKSTLECGPLTLNVSP